MEFFGVGSHVIFLLPPVLAPNEVVVAALWDGSQGADLDLHMMGPGNRTQYPTDEGVVDWAWLDKKAELPYASWTDISNPSVWSGEVIDIAKLNYSSPYDFMLFLWSRITGGDDSVTWGNTSPAMFLYGGSATGLGYAAWYSGQPTPPPGFDYGYWSPFSLQPDGSGHLRIVDDSSPYDPAISLADIAANNQLYYPCEYPTYCPYPLP
jgi:hypothetical protein